MLFNNLAPRLQSVDLLIDMPCSLPVYIASSATDCYANCIAERGLRLPRLAEVVAMFFQDDWGDTELALSDKLTGLHLFVLILGKVFTVLYVLNMLTFFQRSFRSGY